MYLKIRGSNTTNYSGHSIRYISRVLFRVFKGQKYMKKYTKNTTDGTGLSEKNHRQFLLALIRIKSDDIKKA